MIRTLGDTVLTSGKKKIHIMNKLYSLIVSMLGT